MKKKYLKKFTAPIIALAIFIIIELLIFLIFRNSHLNRKIASENLLNIGFFKRESVSKELISAKNYLFFDKKPDIAIVGDCSALHSIKPKIINQYLPQSKIINLATTAEIGWEGYFAMTELYLKHYQDLEYLIFYTTPYGLDSLIKNKFGSSANGFADLYQSKWSFVNWLPSLYFRKNVLESAYYPFSRHYLQNQKNVFLNFSQPEIDGNIFKLSDYIVEEGGWLPVINSAFTADKDIPDNFCGSMIANNQQDSIKLARELYKNLNILHKMVKKYDKKLIIIFNPVACRSSSLVSPINKALQIFKENNPDVIIPFDFISTIEVRYFADRLHLNNVGADYYSAIIGEELKKIID